MRTTEVESSDAPAWFGADEASAWASGWNSAIRAARAAGWVAPDVHAAALSCIKRFGDGYEAVVHPRAAIWWRRSDWVEMTPAEAALMREAMDHDR